MSNKLFLFITFLLLYLIGVLVNVTIITAIYTDHHLHSPLYLFLCNLSCVDIYFTTTTIPNLLYMLLSGNNTIPFKRCFTQMYFFYLAPSIEDVLLVAMAFDRYVAICNPLHYHFILNRKMFHLLVALTYVAGSLNSLVFTIPASKMVFHRSNTIQQFFCEAKAMAAIACSGVNVFFTTVYIDMLLVGLSTFLCSFTSYAKIISVIMTIKSKAGRRKAFSTCSSHLIVIILYYATASAVYLQPTSKNAGIQMQIITVFYAVVTPMINPLIYSLRNQELMTTIKKGFSKQLAVSLRV